MKLAIAYFCISLFFVLLRGKLLHKTESRKQTAFNSVRVCIEILALTWVTSYFNGNPPPSTKHVLFAAILWGALFAWKYTSYKKTGSLPAFKWSPAFPVTLFVILFIRISAIWILRTFPVNDVESVITTLRLPLDGFTVIFVKNYLVRALLPIVALTAALSCFFGEVCSIFKKPKITSITISGHPAHYKDFRSVSPTVWENAIASEIIDLGDMPRRSRVDRTGSFCDREGAHGT